LENQRYIFGRSSPARDEYSGEQFSRSTAKTE
jgi:hypothetical protein